MAKVEMRGVAEQIDADFVREVGGTGYYDFFHRKVAEKARAEAEKLVARPPILPGDVLRLGGHVWEVTGINPGALLTNYPVGDGMNRLTVPKRVEVVVEVRDAKDLEAVISIRDGQLSLTTAKPAGENAIVGDFENYEMEEVKITSKGIVEPESLFALACLRVAYRERERWRRALTPIVVIAGLSLISAARLAVSSSGWQEAVAFTIVVADFSVAMFAWGVEIRYSNLVEEYLNRPEVKKLRGGG